MIELRGVILPIMDLRKQFGVHIDEQLDAVNKLIIVSIQGKILGLRVDRVLGELRVPRASVPTVGTPCEPASGAARHGSRVCANRTLK